MVPAPNLMETIAMLRTKVLAGLLAMCLVAPTWFAYAAADPDEQTRIEQDQAPGGQAERPARRGRQRDRERDEDESERENALAVVREAGIKGDENNGPKVGEEAPDFSLQPLKFYEFGIDDAAITQENAGELYKPVRLSAFRDKKPVALIFGSYT